MSKEKNIINSWHVNAQNWIELIGNNGIESRKIATNEAIVNAVCKHNPQTVFDLGCGEGWLAAILNARGIQTDGCDVVPALVASVSQKVSGNFFVASYEDIAAGKIKLPQQYDCIVINFALIGKESTEKLLAALPSYLKPNGRLLIQTLHPYTRKEMNDYISGWKQGSWDGLGDAFTKPYEWYFRTLEDWQLLLQQSGFKFITATNIQHPQQDRLLSIIFECGN
jgi:2-polyprenyl-3-methyl-5-hydroxy-6-metoxy-1,4-benzoquinol methylase